MKRLLCVGLLLCLAGCASGGGGVKAKKLSPSLAKTPEMEKTFQEAEKIFYSRRFDVAKQAYLTYLQQFPFNAFTPKTFFRLGEIYLHEGDFKQAINDYKRSLAKGIHPDWGVLAIYKVAVCYSRLDDLKKVLSTLDKIPPDSTDSNVGLRAGSLRVTTATRLGDLLEEKRGYLEVIDAYQGVRPGDTKVGEMTWVVGEKKAHEEIRHWIVQTDEETGGGEAIGRLKAWAKRFEGKPSGGYLSWKLARLFHKKGDYGNAGGWAKKYLELYPKHEFASEARKMLAEVDKRGGDAVTPAGGRALLGVLLPLSGKFGVYGESVLHGLECAAGVFTPCRGDLGMNLLIRDTQGDPHQAARIVHEFASNPDVRAVVGPLPQVEIDQAVAAAESEGLPMITLSQKPDVARAGAFIFRNFLTVSDQVKTIVDYACSDKRWKKLAILYPEGAEEYRTVFEKEVGRCGGKIVARSSYPAETKSFAEAVRGLKLSTTGEQGTEAPFQALFIPDVYRKIPAVAAALKAAGIEGVHLLGGAGWNHPGLLSGGAEGLEGAAFVDGFYAKGSSFPTRDFVSMFSAAYGVDPTLLEAYAYDTLRLLGELIKTSPEIVRADLQKSLARKRNFPGVTGTISFDEEGDAQRRLTVLSVEQGEIREVK